MTREELLKKIDFEKSWLYDCGIFGSDVDIAFHAIKKSVEALEKEPCEDCISRQAVIDIIEKEEFKGDALSEIEKLPPVNPQNPKTGHCKDCKWWKESDGTFKRGIGAESKCHLNTDVVYEGLGYCYMFEPKESEDK